MQCVNARLSVSLAMQGRHQDAEKKYNKAMHYLDPDSFEAEGPGVSADEVTQLGHAFIPCLLNRYTPLYCSADRVALEVASGSPDGMCSEQRAFCDALTVRAQLAGLLTARVADGVQSEALRSPSVMKILDPNLAQHAYFGLATVFDPVYSGWKLSHGCQTPCGDRLQ